MILVNINPAYRTTELALRAAPLRAAGLLICARPSSRAPTTARWSARSAATCPRSSTSSSSATRSTSCCAARRAEIEWPELDFDEPINIQYTSGTTGSPKGATLSHHNILNNGYFVGEFCGYTEEDRVCIPVPFYHCFGMVMGNLGSVTHGACMVIPAPAFEPRATLAAVAAGALHERSTACRRCSSPSSSTPISTPST